MKIEDQDKNRKNLIRQNADQSFKKNTTQTMKVLKLKSEECTLTEY